MNEYQSAYEKGFQYGYGRFMGTVEYQNNPYPRDTEDYWDFLNGHLDGYDRAEDTMEARR